MNYLSPSFHLPHRDTAGTGHPPSHEGKSVGVRGHREAVKDANPELFTRDA